MLGISPELSAELANRGYSETDLLQLFGPKAYRGHLRVVYQRNAAGDRTSGLPSNKHAYYISRGWVAVAIADDPPAPPAARAVSPLPEPYGTGDRMALYRKGKQEAIFSTQQHANLSGKGFEFVRPTTPRENYLLHVGSKTLSPEERAIADSLPHVDGDAPKTAKK